MKNIFIVFFGIFLWEKIFYRDEWIYVLKGNDIGIVGMLKE